MKVRSIAHSLAGIALALLPARWIVADDVVFERGIEYSNPEDQHLQLNLARPKEQKGLAPGVICIHGGGFRAGNRDRWNDLCQQLAQRGYVAATVSYRLAPKYPFPAAVHDVKAAVRWLRANADKYQVDPARIGVVGDSAGGHLAMFLGVTAGVEAFEGAAPSATAGSTTASAGSATATSSSAVSCVVDYYGPSDFTKSYGKSVDAGEVLPLFLGGDLDHARERHIQASPLNWVTPQAAPTLLIHGTKDPYVAYEQATWMYDRLKAAGVESQLLELKGAGHGFKGADAQRAEEVMFGFFEKYLRPAREHWATWHGHGGPLRISATKE